MNSKSSKNCTASSIHRIAVFISPHGYGHAARVSAILSALHKIIPNLYVHIFTSVPSNFFRDSVTAPFHYQTQLVDVGFVQDSSLAVNLDKTIDALDAFYPVDPALVHTLAAQIAQIHCELVICDIAPIGILVANELGIPSVLVENFTWDWLYEAYAADKDRLVTHIEYLRNLFARATHHIQTSPVCNDFDTAITTAPVSRRVRSDRSTVRGNLSVSASQRIVLITMGGIPENYPFVSELNSQNDTVFIIPGGSRKVMVRNNLILLPFHSEFYHPDLVNASDAIIGKVGYSTLAEVYHAGVGFGYVTRADFRESPVLVAYIRKHIPGIAIREGEFRNGTWISRLPELLAKPPGRTTKSNGAVEAAGHIAKILR